MNDSWMTYWTLAQAQPQAGAAPAPAPSQPVNAVGVPGSTSGTAAPAASPGGGSGGQSAAGGGLGGMIWMFPILIVAMILMTTMTGRKDKKKKAEMMASLKKHARVQMIGGEIGVITDLTDDEVVLRVEEGRIRFARSAVQAVLSAPKERGDSVSELKGEPKATSV